MWSRRSSSCGRAAWSTTCARGHTPTIVRRAARCATRRSLCAAEEGLKMADYAKPLPGIDAETKPYWDGAKAHELRVQRCSGCGKLRWPPQGFCPHCHSWESSWAKVAYTGTVVSYVVVHQATAPAFADDIPYAIA